MIPSPKINDFELASNEFGNAWLGGNFNLPWLTVNAVSFRKYTTDHSLALLAPMRKS